MRRVPVLVGVVLALAAAPPTAAQPVAGGIDVERVPPKLVHDEQGGERRVFPVRLLCGRIDAAPARPQAAAEAPRDSGEWVGADEDAGGRADAGGRIGIAGGERRLDLFDPEPPAAPGAAASPGGPSLLPGAYRTLVTIYNPNGIAAYPIIRAVPTTPALADGRADRVPPLGERLPPRRGLEIDCADLVGLLAEAFRLDADFLGTGFAGGLLVVETGAPALDVTAVYTFRPAD